MKRIMTFAFALTIAAALALTTTSCSNEDILTDNNELSATNGVQVTVGAGFDEATTRSEVAIAGDKRVLTFTTGDRLYVYGEIDADKLIAGYLTMKGSPTNDNKSAQFTGTYGTDLKAYSWNITSSRYEETSHSFSTTDILGECTNAKAVLVDANSTFTVNPYLENYRMSGTFAGCASTVDDLLTKGLEVKGNYVSASHSFTLSNNKAIFNCTFSGLTPSTTYNVSQAIYNVVKYDVYSFTTDANGVGTIAFVASTNVFNNDWMIEIDDNNGHEFCSIPLGARSFETKKYNITRNFVNLASLTEEFTAQNNDVLMGTLNGNRRVSIANDATVTLSGANINGDGTHTEASWPGIMCLGNAKIILAHGTTNYANALADAMKQEHLPGIFVPAGSTLTITGKGTLNASCNPGGSAAGIGGYKNTSCGNIVIQGGIINAWGGDKSAGIGGGYGSNNASSSVACGDITISGGTINATGGSYSPGIGSGNGEGHEGTCGNITITKGVTSVTATKGSDAPYSIGKSVLGNCGTIKIGGTTYYDGSSFKNSGDTYLANSPFNYQL